MDDSPKAVVHVLPPARRRVADGLAINQIHLPAARAELMDPFLAIDSFQMAEPFFPPHPHAGFSAVTYMLPDSPGGFVNRDSLGHRDLIGPGTMHWTAAGSGMLHEEVPWERGLPAHGLQIFVNLAAADKLRPPEALHLDHGGVPVVEVDGHTTLAVTGAHERTTSPLTAPTPVTVLHVTLAPGARWDHFAPAGHSRFVVVLGGTATVGAEQVDVPTDGTALLSLAGSHVTVANRATQPCRFVIAGGPPLREPVVFHGPFCMNTAGQINDAIDRYQRGEMGSLEPSF